MRVGVSAAGAIRSFPLGNTNREGGWIVVGDGVISNRGEHIMASHLGRLRWTIGLTVLLAVGLALTFGQDVQPAYKVTIKDDKPVVIESAVPVDPQLRIRYAPQGLGVQINEENGGTLHLSHFPTLNVDGQIQQVGGFGGFNNMPGGGRFEKQNQALGRTPGGKLRHGFTTIYTQNDLRITMVAEAVPTKAVGKSDKRRTDAMLIRYLVENKGQKSHTFGLRVYMDVYVISNDGAQFACPTMPGKVLNGIELKGKTLPDYVQLLERPDLNNPGFVAHLTLNLGSGLEKPDRVVLTQHGNGLGGWDMAPQQAFDTALGVFWEPKEIKPGGKREFAYGYGKGITLPPEGEGQYEVRLGGSFVPGKLFTVTAVVGDPAPGQSLTLQLPDGMELAEGRATQPVPPGTEQQANSVVMWRARVTRPGAFPLQVRSSHGLTQTKHVTVEKAP
jgi:hypothetical protein